MICFLFLVYFTDLRVLASKFEKNKKIELITPSQQLEILEKILEKNGNYESFISPNETGQTAVIVNFYVEVNVEGFLANQK